MFGHECLPAGAPAGGVAPVFAPGAGVVGPVVVGLVVVGVVVVAGVVD